MECSSPALFVALQLYLPSILFVMVGNRSRDPSEVFIMKAVGGGSPSLNFQDNFGSGSPLALQRMLVVFPSGTVWFLGLTSTTG